MSLSPNGSDRELSSGSGEKLCVLPHGHNGIGSVCYIKPQTPEFPSDDIGTRIGMGMRVVDSGKVEKSQLILVVEDVYETRAGIDTLLKADGYRVALASTELEAGIGHQTE